MKKLKGSLTLEAVISFTFFITFMFTLLCIVKFSLIRITLNAATAETAKQIANAAYPLSYLIEYENSVNEGVDAYEGEMALVDGISNSNISSSISSLFNTDPQATSSVVNTVTRVKDLISGGDNARNAGIGLIRGFVADLEREAGAIVACKIFDNYIEKSGLHFNKEDLTVSIVKFPQSDYSYDSVKDGENFTKFGFDPDMFSAEDVVIGIEYKYDFALPFMPSFEMTMREVAVEHAWLYGGGNVITNREDGIDYSELEKLIFGDGEIVYLGGKLTGSKYHSARTCRTLWHGSIKASLEHAQANGYTECRVCYGQ